MCNYNNTLRETHTKRSKNNDSNVSVKGMCLNVSTHQPKIAINIAWHT